MTRPHRFSRLLGGPGGSGGWTIDRGQAAVSAVNALEPGMLARSDAELRALTGEFRSRLDSGASLDALLAEAFAVVREAARRTLGQRPVDSQVMGGVALHLGALAEMKTGEGKTLAITLPAYLHALTGLGVHVMTANDYLATRDARWMGPVYRALGLECGLVVDSDRYEHERRRAAYAADVTYGTPYAIAYDYLRDNLAWQVDELVQRDRRFAIVDEADLLLIDEARQSSMIAMDHEDYALRERTYSTMAKLARLLRRDQDYVVDDRAGSVSLTDAGTAHVEELFGATDLYRDIDAEMLRRLDNALIAKEVMKADRDYVVADGEIRVLSTLTGRLQANTRFRGGLNQALQAKEGLPVGLEQQVLASITVREYLRRYERLAALTGVATEAEGYRRLYGLETVQIPTHRPVARIDLPVRIFTTDQARIGAGLDEIAARRAAGRPVLVGTASIAQSAQLADALRGRGIPHEVLSAKNHEQEAEIIARSGRVGAVTVVTRMAGRGVDIRLGGDDPDERDAIVRAGGLYVLAIDLYETRRLETHMRGRAGRRGDPGESAVFLSLQDASLLGLLGPRIVQVMAASADSAVAPGGKLVNRALERSLSQRTDQLIERLIAAVRYDDVIGDQRDEVYRRRQSILTGGGLGDWVRQSVDDVVGSCVADAKPGPAGIEQLWSELADLYPMTVTIAALTAEHGREPSQLPRTTLTALLRDDARRAYARRTAELGEEIIAELERRVILSLIDRCWGEHLVMLDDLLGDATLHALTGSDRLARFRSESARLFDAMSERIKREAMGNLFNLEVQIEAVEQDGAEAEGVAGAGE